MPEIIKHRQNRVADLDSVDTSWGVEIDIRSDVKEPAELHLAHDPWSKGESFERWLTVFQAKGIRGTLILNTKEDGLENRCLELLAKFRIENYFFLDTALPTLVKRACIEANPHFAVRLSCYEPLSSLMSFREKARWVWVDCFGGEPVSPEIVRRAREAFKVCLVSPELQGQPLDGTLGHFQEIYSMADAICTKTPARWQSI